MDTEALTERLEIEDLLQRYTTAIDNQDFELLDTVFTSDAVLDYQSSGGPRGPYPEVREWLRTTLSAFTMSQHMIGKTSYEFADDGRVRCRSIFHNPMGLPVDAEGRYDPDGSALHTFFVGGWYNDICVKAPDGWRIAEKVEEQAHFTGTIPEGLLG